MNNKAKGCKIVISQCHAKKHFEVGFFIFVLVYAYLEDKKKHLAPAAQTQYSTRKFYVDAQPNGMCSLVLSLNGACIKQNQLQQILRTHDKHGNYHNV